jgi:hypothetical protein
MHEYRIGKFIIHVSQECLAAIGIYLVVLVSAKIGENMLFFRGYSRYMLKGVRKELLRRPQRSLQC